MAKRLVSGELKAALNEYEAAEAKRIAMVRALDDMIKPAEAHLHSLRIINDMVRDGMSANKEELTDVQAEAMRELLKQLGGRLVDLEDGDYDVILE